MKNPFEKDLFSYQVISNSDILSQNAAQYAETVKNLKPILHDLASECAISTIESVASLGVDTVLSPEELYLPFKKWIKDFQDDPNIYYELCAVYAAEITKRLKMITEKPTDLVSFFPMTESIHTNQVPAKIAYMQSLYTDDAFDRFSGYMQNPEAQYQDSFAFACEEVYYGNLPYCILPYSTSQSGIIESFRRLLDKYDLKLRLICSVHSQDDDAFTLYALLSSSIMDNTLQITPTRFEFSFIPISSESFSTGAFLHTFRFLKTTPVQINTVPLSYSQDQFEYRITLDISHSDLYAVLMYLNIVLPQYNMIGLYTHI